MKLKKGDQVIVLRGKDKGRKGKIKQVFPKSGRILIPTINIFKKHARKQSEKKPGGIIEFAKPLAVCKVALVCPKCKQPARIGYQIDKNGQKRRICRKCQALV